MTCREFQSQWDALLDADARVAAIGAGSEPDRFDTRAKPALDDSEAALLAHAAGCPECRQIAAQWRVLRHAIAAWRQPPVAPAGLADRILAAKSMPQTLQWKVVEAIERKQSRRDHLILACTLAASFLGIILLSRAIRMRDPSPDGRANPPAIVSRDQDLQAVADLGRDPGGHQALNRVLAEATSATWDLARSASEPAARISRDMLDATTRSEDAPLEPASDRPVAVVDRSDLRAVGLTVAVPSLDNLAPDSSAASAVLQHVGDHFSAGVRPLSDTARHAFGFLIGPAAIRRSRATVRRPRKGPDGDETCHDRRRFLGDSRPEAIGLWSGS